MRLLIAIVLGALLGAIDGRLSSAAVGAAIGWLVVQSIRQQRELLALRRQVEGRPGSGDESQVALVATGATATPATTAEPMPPTAAPVPLSSTPEPPAPANIDVGVSIGGVAFARARAWLFGGNTIVKAGIGILFIGLAFLAKYASEHARLPIEWRLAAIGSTAILLLGFGWRLRLRRADYAQVLQGGAVAALYLTLFAAFRYYGVLAALPAFALMVAVAVLAAALALLQNARALAIVGALGGFATPLIVSTGSDDAVALFSYYLVLDLGVAAVAWFRTWRLLNLIGFVATFGVATAWGVLRYEPANFVRSEAFLIAFFLLFIVILMLPARRVAVAAPVSRIASATPSLPDRWVNGSLLFSLPTVVFALQYGMVRSSAYGAALSALALAVFYVGLAAAMRRRPVLHLTFEASLAIATVFLTLVIPFALDPRSTAGAWSLEAAGLVWIGFRQRRPLARGFGYLLLVMAAGAMLFGHVHRGLPSAFFNAYLFNGLMAAAAALAAAYFVHRADALEAVSAAIDDGVDVTRAAESARLAAGLAARNEPGAATQVWFKLPQGERLAEPLLISLATLWLIGTTAWQLEVFVDARFELAALIGVVSTVAAIYAGLATRLAWPGIALPTMLHSPLLFLCATATALRLANPLQDGGWWAWALGFAGHALVLRWAVKCWPRAFAHAAHALGAVTLALLGALLGRSTTASWGDAESAWPWLGWLIVPALLLLGLPRPAAARVWPIRALPEAYRATACSVIALGLCVWTLVANIASDGTAAPLPHLPFLNPLDLGIGIALVATFLWLRMTGLSGHGSADSGLGAERQAHPSANVGVVMGRRWPWVLGVGAVFVWVNAVLLRGFHHYGGVPYRAEAWIDSLVVQTGMTLLWSVLALAAMWIAARRAARWPWLAGAALLVAVVAKLLLVDLAGSGSVMRIVSFIGAGVLMLVIGYVAPLPARKVRDATV